MVPFQGGNVPCAAAVIFSAPFARRFARVRQQRGSQRDGGGLPVTFSVQAPAQNVTGRFQCLLSSVSKGKAARLMLL